MNALLTLKGRPGFSQETLSVFVLGIIHPHDANKCDSKSSYLTPWVLKIRYYRGNELESQG
jgi:hypothetical protein